MAETLKNFLKEHESNKEFIQFVDENKITNKIFKDNQQIFVDYLASYNLCKKRENINKCQQEIAGYRLKLVINSNQVISTVLTDCLHRINNLDQKQVMNKFLIRHYDDSLLSLSWSKNFLVVGKEREQIVNSLKYYQKTNNYPGLYLYGETQVGKTFIFILIANKLIQKKHTVCFISWPDFIIEVKNDFKHDFKSENRNDNKIEQLKNCDFLFIDDLGSEKITAWERDELLFPILNARILPLKTTFINSIYSIDELSDLYNIQKNNIEKTKVKRLTERIKTLSLPIKLTKQNLNKDN